VCVPAPSPAVHLIFKHNLPPPRTRTRTTAADCPLRFSTDFCGQFWKWLGLSTGDNCAPCSVLRVRDNFFCPLALITFLWPQLVILPGCAFCPGQRSPGERVSQQLRRTTAVALIMRSVAEMLLRGQKHPELAFHYTFSGRGCPPLFIWHFHLKFWLRLFWGVDLLGLARVNEVIMGGPLTRRNNRREEYNLFYLVGKILTAKLTGAN